MKKTYMKPAVETVEVEIQSLMVVSFTSDGESGTASISDTEVKGDVLSKDTDFDLWGEDE